MNATHVHQLANVAGVMDLGRWMAETTAPNVGPAASAMSVPEMALFGPNNTP